jgi:hypothetical protein
MRPARQLKNLLAKIQTKEAVSLKKPGKRTKRWRKWAAQYTPPVAG